MTIHPGAFKRTRSEEREREKREREKREREEREREERERDKREREKREKREKFRWCSSIRRLDQQDNCFKKRSCSRSGY